MFELFWRVFSLSLDVGPDDAIQVEEVIHPEPRNDRRGSLCDGPAGCALYEPGDGRRGRCQAACKMRLGPVGGGA